jgi:hypothetical protein
VAISHGIALKGSTPQWPLGRGIHALQGCQGPHLVDLDGRVDLDDLVLLLVALSQGNAQECF